MNENIEFVLNDKRNCRSNNMQSFFKRKRNHVYNNVIRHEGRLWFVLFGFNQDEKGFAGTLVMKVATQGVRASTYYPVSQHESGYENVTNWFWEQYKKDGILAFPEIWGNRIVPILRHKEAHSI